MNWLIPVIVVAGLLLLALLAYLLMQRKVEATETNLGEWTSNDAGGIEVHKKSFRQTL
jgi:hypothetical protein